MTIAASDIGTEGRTSNWVPDAGLLVLGVLLYFLLGVLGRSTIHEGEVLSLVWPAAGAAMLLFGLTRPRQWVLVSALVALATVVLNLLTGATWPQVAIFVVSNIVQGIFAVLILRALAPQLRGAGGDRPLEQVRDFWPILTAAVLGSLVGAVVGGIGRGVLLDNWSWLDLLVWFGRNVVGCVVVYTTAVLLLAAWHRLREPGGRAELFDSLEKLGAELVLVTAATAALYLSAFDWYISRPVAFPLLLPTVWIGLRFSPAVVAVHSLAVCTTVVVYTVVGAGPFAAAGSWPRQVLVCQFFMALVFCLGIVLALSRTERATLTRTITEARASAENQARLMSTIIDSMHDGVTVLEEGGQVLKRNPAGAEIIRSTTDSALGVMAGKFALATDGQPMPPEEYPWVRAFAGENVVDQDMVLIFHDGSPSRTVAVSARILPSLDGDGPRQAVLIYHDVTQERAQRSELESFAAVVAHDLLGPLAVVEGWTELLSSALDESPDEGPGPTRVEAGPQLARIRDAAVGMRRLIEDLLESATSRDPDLRATVVDLEAIAGSVAEQRALVTDGVPPEISVASLPRAYADGVLVRQLLDNLIGNAVKYVVPGETARVAVTGRLVGDLVEVTVADEGIGIPPSQRDEIFEAFHRGHTAQAYDGHGIGLSVCKRIVERHGGRIAARPPLGDRGSRIVFTLPAVRNGK